MCCHRMQIAARVGSKPFRKLLVQDLEALPTPVLPAAMTEAKIQMLFANFDLYVVTG